MSLIDAAFHVLDEAGHPIHYAKLTDQILERGIAKSASKTPAASLNAVLAVDIKGKGSSSRFRRVSAGVYGLRAWVAPDTHQAGDSTGHTDDDRRVKVPLFPLYSEVRQLMPAWDGRLRSDITGLHSTFAHLRGTPQEPVDWTSPDEWIPKRLKGSDQTLATAIWSHSKGAVNPRHTYGHWLLVCKYDFMREGPDGSMRVTSRGANFVSQPGGIAEQELDEGEGLVKLLSMVAERGPARPGELVEPWGEYLSRRSAFGKESTIKDTLRRRLRNLVERGFTVRSSTQYTITDSGLAYLNQTGGGDGAGTDELQQLLTLAKAQNTSIRDSIQELLSSMDPIAFEHLVKRVLEAMDYDNVKVTKPSNDGGVDVVADIELGITSVREVVQVKRHKKTIQRKDLDALRGSLHRFDAVRGTIITSGRFSKGTSAAAFERGAAPITLIDGAKLIDLLIEHEIGARKKSIEVLELDPDAFADVGLQDEEGEKGQ